jgi:hypothetical protein
MNNVTTPTPDPITMLGELAGDDLRRRLSAIDAERRALMVLLRSVQARERERLRHEAHDRAGGKAG